MYPIPFCPNPHCENHRTDLHHQRWYTKAGTFNTASGKPRQRYLCRACGMRFSSRTFHLDYYARYSIDYNLLFDLVRSGTGIRDMARIFRIAPSTVLTRISRLARQLLAIHALLLSEMSPRESLAVDGFLSFTGTQYYPTEISHLVGSQSQFTFFMNAANLRRRGTMTTAQKRKREKYEAQFLPPGGELAGQFKSLCYRLLDILSHHGDREVDLFSDEHAVYFRHLTKDPIFRELLNDGTLRHRRISSRKARTVSNPLFPVNYLDRELRMMSADHVRETCKFARNMNNMMERLWIRIFDLNYIKPHRINRCETSDKVSGEIAGIDGELIRRECSSMFWKRRFLTLSNHYPWLDLRTWLRGWVTPLQPRKIESLPRYVLQ